MHEILKRVAPDFIDNIRKLNKKELNKIMSETVCHCKIKENAEIIAKILDYDINGKIADDIVSVTHLEEHGAYYFCADGYNKNKEGNENK